VAAFKGVERGEEVAGQSHLGTLGRRVGAATEIWARTGRIR
jgi:hypothetical protein